MIARHEGEPDIQDVWARIAAPLPKEAISWRQDGRPTQRDGKYFARFVSYIDAQFVRERLDAVVPGEWSLSQDLLPLAVADGDGVSDATPFAFKARLQVLGVTRECVGSGRDYKQAATDAFKRAAVRFGVGHELYDMGMAYVEMDGDGKYAKPIEDPQVAYDRRHGGKQEGEQSRPPQQAHVSPPSTNGERSETPKAESGEVPPCPKCGGKMWDNRLGKKNPKAPDFKCRDKSCDGLIWPPKPPKSGGKGWRPPAGGPVQDVLIEEPEGPPVWEDPAEMPF